MSKKYINFLLFKGKEYKLKISLHIYPPHIFITHKIHEGGVRGAPAINF
jgi:hypothetical protein